MFDKVWEWARGYRLRETNIGIVPSEIPTAIRAPVDGVQAWAEFGTYEPDELSISECDRIASSGHLCQILVWSHCNRVGA